MRQVAQQKLVMNEHKAQGRALANGKDGVVMLGGVALPESVLQGRGLRVLLEAQGTEAVPVEGLVQGERRSWLAARMLALDTLQLNCWPCSQHVVE